MEQNLPQSILLNHKTKHDLHETFEIKISFVFYGIVNIIMGNEEDAFHSLFNMTCRWKESKSNIRKISKRIQLESYLKTHHEFFQTHFEFQRSLFKHVLFFCFTPERYHSILIFCSIRHISVIFSVITERFYSRILDLP